MYPNTVIKIGSQVLLPIADHYRFVIHDVLPERGFKFKFGVRDRIIDYVISKAKHLEVRFKQFPDLSFNLNPIQWKALGKRQKQNGIFKNQPITFYCFFVDYKWDLTQKKHKQNENQGYLFA